MPRPKPLPPIEKVRVDASAAELVTKWTRLTEDQESVDPWMPLGTLLAEALELADLCDAYFEPRVSEAGRLPGLVSLEASRRISRDSSTELRELSLAIGAVHGSCAVRADDLSRILIERAHRVESDLRAALAFALEDGEQPGGAAQLARLRAEHHASRSRNDLALALEGYAVLCSEHQALLATIGLGPARIDEAVAIASELRERSAEKLARRSKKVDLVSTRNRLIGALRDRIRSVRRAFRFVFRDHPEIVRSSASSHERSCARRRALRLSARARARGTLPPRSLE